MDNKKSRRLRRAIRSRKKISELGVHRLSVFRTPRHIYAQVFSADGSSVVASASTLDSAEHNPCLYSGNISSAEWVGRVIAQRAMAAGILRVAFDRSGFRYHGRVKALAEAARGEGLLL